MKKLSEFMKDVTDVHETKRTYEDEVSKVLKLLKVSLTLNFTNTITVKQFTMAFK